MAPLILKLKVIQSGDQWDGSGETQVDDPSAMTVGMLKQKVFSASLADGRPVRFIASGRLLRDSELLADSGLTTGAFLHVSIGERCIPSPESPASGDAVTEVRVAKSSEPWLLEIDPVLLCGAGFFAVTGAMLQVGWQRRGAMSPGSSQPLFIAIAVWVYLVLCHGIPALIQALRGGRSRSSAAMEGRGSGTFPMAGGQRAHASSAATAASAPSSSQATAAVAIPSTAAAVAPEVKPLTDMF